MRKRYPRPNLGDLPSVVVKELLPSEEITPEWINPFTQVNIPFTLTDANVSVKVVPANPRRTYILIQNKSAAADMFIAFGAEANSYNGIIIIPRGNYELIGGEKGGAYCPKDSINLMSATANVQGVVTEGISTNL